MRFLKAAKVDKEALALLVFIFAILLVKLSLPWNETLVHDFPHALSNTDSFYASAISDHILETGSYASTASYMVAGWKDVFGYSPPILYHASAMLSGLSGLSVYDITYLTAVLLLVFTCLLAYLAIRDLNKDIALLSLPFMLGFYIWTMDAVLTWGNFPFLTGSLFTAGTVWAATRIGKKGAIPLIAIMLLGTFAGHTPAFLFASGFLGVWWVFNLLKTRNFDLTKAYLAAYGLFAVFCSYYIYIFATTWLAAQTYSERVLLTAPEFPVTELSALGTPFIIFLSLGAALLVWKRKLHPAVLMGFFFLLASYGNYIGLERRALQLRMLWQVYLSVFAGASIYYIGKRINKLKYVPLLAILLTALFVPLHWDKIGSVYDSEHWEGIMWLRENTPEEAKLFFFYGEPYTQMASLYATHRLVYEVDLGDFYTGGLKSLQLMLPDTWFPYFDGFAVNYHFTEEPLPLEATERDICEMDYFVFGSGNEDFEKLNDGIKARLKATEVFSNAKVTILKNDGGECLE